MLLLKEVRLMQDRLPLTFRNLPPAVETGDDLSPLNTIRTETVLSKFPVHNLAKTGKVDIRIIRHGESGAVQLKWEVSHSDRYGQPRQLAYKLDTLVVNRRLDQEGRPLPQIVRIGSLKDICKQLGMQESGKNTRDVRTAFLQNATAFINAQITYRTAEGGERHLEAGFTRYGVVFTGEILPDGRRADAVYITLNPPYWEVVNNAPVRPLDYDYLKELTPGAQRFYEVVSFRIYAALKNGWTLARITYSDYCAFSAQQRYFDHEHFRVQMYKIHKPHLNSGYLKSVSITQTTDGEGKCDWVLSYVPGAKARAEFRVFSESGPVPVQTSAPQASRIQVEAGNHPDTAALVERGISAKKAVELLSDPGIDASLVRDQLEWGDFLINRAQAGSFRNPPGFYIWLISQKITPPPEFQSSRSREVVPGAEVTEEQMRTQALRAEYEEFCRSEVENRIRAMDPAEYSDKLQAKIRELGRAYSNLAPATMEQIARGALLRDVRTSAELPEFESFCLNRLQP
jgi:hypothetical protein